MFSYGAKLLWNRVIAWFLTHQSAQSGNNLRPASRSATFICTEPETVKCGRRIGTHNAIPVAMSFNL